ncbi:hypothetical protein BpHYR1_029316 [Brachionus plicatilis]|uniref:Uncharacterized protein n=1 Tax=Brachionus plicatilis TaxID=10195 RepID=A0A3M7PG14_BRAPC|nr:hypothetical protein BpHYR1_029316 [Brachionus plicatilis]
MTKQTMNQATCEPTERPSRTLLQKSCRSYLKYLDIMLSLVKLSTYNSFLTGNLGAKYHSCMNIGSKDIV